MTIDNLQHLLNETPQTFLSDHLIINQTHKWSKLGYLDNTKYTKSNHGQELIKINDFGIQKRQILSLS